MSLPDRLGLDGLLGPEIQDPDEETFLLFAHDRPAAQNLGFVDPRAPLLDLSVAGCDLTLHQSPAILTSSRPGGTTGAVLWKITPAVAAWLARPDNFLFTGHCPLLGPTSCLLELGCGISGLIGLVLTHPARPGPRPRHAARKKTRKAASANSAPVHHAHAHANAAHHNTVARYVLTDQSYVAKLVQRNLEANGRTADSDSDRTDATSSLYFRPLDWETDVVSSDLLRSPEDTPAVTTSPLSFDAVIACDCIYNDALVSPLVQTCADACCLRNTQLNNDEASVSPPPTLCIVAQQLREPDVLTAWLTAFHAAFHVWRVPEQLLSEELLPSAGFAVHVGILRSQNEDQEASKNA